MGAREDLALLVTPALRTEYRANAMRSAVLAKRPQSGPLTAERNGLTLVFDADPVLIRNRRGQVTGTDAMVRAFRAGNEVKVDPHRVCANPPLMVPDGTFTEAEEEHHGVKRLVRRLNYREDPWQAYLDWLFTNIEEHPNPAGWRTRGTVTTVYAGTADGSLESHDATWAAAFAGANLVVDAAGSTYCWLGSANAGNKYVQMGFYPFDTSAIADTDTVSAAVFSLYGRDGNASRAFELRAWIYDFGATVTTADWRTSAQLSALTQVAHFPAASTWSTSGYNDFTDDALPANVSLTGTTYIIVSDDTHETGGSLSVVQDVTAYLADRAGTTNDPKLVVTHAAGGGASVTPGVLSLTTSGKAPTVTATANQTVTPGVLAHVLSLLAPTVNVSNNQAVTPDALALVLSLFTPTVSASANVSVTPDVLAMTTSLFAAAVTATANQSVTPPALSLTTALFAAAVTATGNQSVTPDVLALTFSLLAPTVAASGNQSVTPDTLALALTAYAATVTAGGNQSVNPGALALALATFAVTVLTPVSVSPAALSLSLSPAAPSIQTPVVVTPGPGALVTATFAPVVTATANQLVTPSTLALALVLYAATVNGDVASDIPGLVRLLAQPSSSVELSLQSATVGLLATLIDSAELEVGP